MVHDAEIDDELWLWRLRPVPAPGKPRDETWLDDRSPACHTHGDGACALLERVMMRINLF